MLEDLDVVFVDGQMVNLKSYEIETFQNQLKRVRELRTQKIQEIAKVINEIKGEN